MTPPAFQLGDTVKIIGPDSYGNPDYLGKEFTIKEMRLGDVGIVMASAIKWPWYPASSLRLVQEELQVGDYVEVIGPSRWDDDSNRGKIFEIESLHEAYSCLPAGYSTKKFHQIYPASSLRKLTPEEIQSPINTPQNQFNERVEKRLAAIDKRLEAHKDEIVEMGLRLNVDGTDIKDIEKRLDILEGEAPEVVDSNSDRVICPNARFSPKSVCMLCGNSNDLCHDRIVRNACEYEKVLNSMRKER